MRNCNDNYVTDVIEKKEEDFNKPNRIVDRGEDGKVDGWTNELVLNLHFGCNIHIPHWFPHELAGPH